MTGETNVECSYIVRDGRRLAEMLISEICVEALMEDRC